MLGASATAGVSPVLLQHPVVVAEGLVVFCRSGRAGSGTQAIGVTGVSSAEIEIALIGVFLAAGIKPGIQVGIGNGFFQFVRHGVGHAISAAHISGRTVRAGALDLATRGTAVHVADERIFNVHAAQGGVRMPAAVLGAESRGLTDARGGQHEVHAVGITRQGPAADGIAERLERQRC